MKNDGSIKMIKSGIGFFADVWKPTLIKLLKEEIEKGYDEFYYEELLKRVNESDDFLNGIDYEEYKCLICKSKYKEPNCECCIWTI